MNTFKFRTLSTLIASTILFRLLSSSTWEASSSVLLENVPHTGQSSQLFLETSHGDAQFLSKVARSVLGPQAIHIPHRVAIRLR
jgi:hypothetical protein